MKKMHYSAGLEYLYSHRKRCRLSDETADNDRDHSPRHIYNRARKSRNFRIGYRRKFFFDSQNFLECGLITARQQEEISKKNKRII